MTTRTTLSGEEMVQRRNLHHAASDSAPLSVYFLIANARLEFSVSHSKDSPLKIPNRERIAISHLRSAAGHLRTHARYPHVRSAILTHERLSSLPTEVGSQHLFAVLLAKNSLPVRFSKPQRENCVCACATVAGGRLTKLTSGSESSGSKWLRVSARFTSRFYCSAMLPHPN